MQEDLVDAAFKVLDVCEFVSVVFRWRTCAEDGEVLHRGVNVKVGGGKTDRASLEIPWQDE